MDGLSRGFLVLERSAVPRTSFTVEVVVETDLEGEEHDRRVNWVRGAIQRSTEYTRDVTTILFFENENGNIVSLTVGGLRNPGPETQELLRNLGQELSKE